MTTQPESSKNTGRKRDDTEMCEICREAPWKPLTASAAGSPVNLFRSQVGGKLKTIRAGCGRNTPAWWMSFDPDTSLWRTCRGFTQRAYPMSSVILPRSALMRNGTVFLLPRLVPLTSERGSYLWPSPAAQEAGESDEWLATLVTKEGEPAKRGERMYDPGLLPRVVQRVEGEEGRMWPTPKSSPSGPDYERVNRPKSGADDLATVVARDTPGQLNPMWVEWLMGYPSGWTDLEDSETL